MQTQVLELSEFGGVDYVEHQAVVNKQQSVIYKLSMRLLGVGRLYTSHLSLISYEIYSLLE